MRENNNFGIKNIIIFLLTIIISWVITQTKVYSRTSSHEQTFLTCDRDVYIAGENMFFRLDLIPASGHNNWPPSEIAYLVLRNSDNNFITGIRVKTENGIAFGSIYLPDTLSSGFFQLVVFTNMMRNMGEDTFFTKEIYVANRFDTELRSIWSDKSQVLDTSLSVQVSEKVDSSGFQQETSGRMILNISTKKKNYTNREQIRAYLGFNPVDDDTLVSLAVSVSEVQSRFPSILQENSTNDLSDVGSADNLSLLKDSYRIHLDHFPEYSAMILKGKVVHSVSGKTAKGVYVLLSTSDSLLNLNYSVTNKDGIFRFMIDDYYLGKKLILNLRTLYGNPDDFHILLDNKFWLENSFHPVTVPFDENFRKFILRSQDIVRVRKAYGTGNVQKKNDKVSSGVVAPLIYSKPQFVIYTADYVPLDDMVELSREVIPYMRLRKKAGVYYARIVNVPARHYFSSGPGIFLDGELINDISQIIPLGSEQVKRIEIMNSQWFLGDISFPGILAVFRKNPERESVERASNTVVTNAGTFAPLTGFSAPDYGDQNTYFPQKPDFRQLLFWNPEVLVKKKEKTKIEFYSSDLSGIYLIHVSGITSKGKHVQAATCIVIGKNNNDRDQL
jgi:hypothetical protein